MRGIKGKKTKKEERGQKGKEKGEGFSFGSKQFVNMLVVVLSHLRALQFT